MSKSWEESACQQDATVISRGLWSPFPPLRPSIHHPPSPGTPRADPTDFSSPSLLSSP